MNRTIIPAHWTWLKLVTLILFFGLCAISVIRALSTFSLSPDSTGYIAAAENLIRTGDLVSNSNSPSWTLEPVSEPYTEQPPGMPYFLVPFLLVLKEPFVGAAAAQASAIILFFVAVYALTNDLQVEPFFQVSCALAFTLFRPLQLIFSYFWSETLFIALTFLAIHFLVLAERNPKPGLYWMKALFMAAAASLTRFIGVFTFGIFVQALLQSRKSRWVRLALSFAFLFGPLIAWGIRNQLLFGSTSMTHVGQEDIQWEKLFQQGIFLKNFISHNAVIADLILVFIFICLLAPFLRPNFPGRQVWRLKTNFSKMHLSSIFLTLLGTALVAFSLSAEWLGIGGSPGIGLKQVALIVLGVLLVARAWIGYTNIIEYVRSWKAYNNWDWWKSTPFQTYSLLLFGGLFQFFGITALSIITPFSPLEDRLLAPSLALLLFAFLVGLYHFSRLVRVIPYTAIIFLIALIVAAVSPAFVKAEMAFTPGFRFPPEQPLWQQINTYPGIKRVTHFYSDYNFNHEIYANRPQKIIVDQEKFKKAGFLKALMGKGNCPFVLVNKGGTMSQLMQQYYKEAGLSERDMANGQFELYAQDCLFSP
jgi:hypothetical protein